MSEAETTTEVLQTTSESAVDASADVATDAPVPPEASAADSEAVPAAGVDEKVKLAKSWESVAQAELKNQRHAARLREERATWEKQVTEARSEVEELKAALISNPQAMLRKLGVEDPREWLDKILRPETEAEKRLERLERELREREEKQTQAQREAAERAAWSSFVGGINADKYPHLSALYEPEEVVELAQKALARHLDSYVKATGRHPTDDEIRAHLERDAQARYERAQKAKSPPPPASEPEAPAAQNSGPGLQSVNGQTRTLTNNAASQAVSAKTPVGFSKEEAKRQLMARLEAETAAVRASK